MRLAIVFLLFLLGGLGWAEESPTPTPPPIFSGKYEVYEDTYNGFKIKIPVEFKNNTKGTNAGWEGPQVDGFITTIFVNSVPMPGVHPQALYDGVIHSKKQDRAFTGVAPVKMAGKFKGKPVYGFRCREVNVNPGTGEAKQANDFHRWFVYVWGNDFAYEVAVCCSYQALGQGKELPPVFEEVLRSFGLVKMK